MSKHGAALMFAGAIFLSAQTPVAAQAPGWTYAYADGAATATRLDAEGENVAVTVSCRPPSGDLVITDHTFGRAARNVRTAAVRIGALSINVPATSEGRGRNARVIVNLPQSPPVLAAVQETDELSVTVNNVTHAYGAGSGRQTEHVARACWLAY